MNYHYRDLITGEPRYIHGTFEKWVLRKVGLLSIWYAVFRMTSDYLSVPDYLLSDETYDGIPEKPATFEVADAVLPEIAEATDGS